MNYADPSKTDPIHDDQTGISEAHIVGNASNAAFYTIFDDAGTSVDLSDGEIGFRVRVAADSNPGGLNVVVWVGMDINLEGKMDLFAGAFEGATIGFILRATAPIFPPRPPVSSLPHL